MVRVVFFAGTGWQSWCIRMAQRRRCGSAAQWTHVALLLPGGITYEATSRGVIQSTLTAHTDRSIIRSVPMTDGQARRVTALARAHVGAEYGFVDIAAVGFDLLTGSSLHLRPTDSMICSQFLAVCLAAGGVRFPRPAISMSPGDLYLALAH